MNTATRARFRWRTRLRGRLPYALSYRVRKGKTDCGDHEWYNSDNVVLHCYHCAVGVRPYDPSVLHARTAEPGNS